MLTSHVEWRTAAPLWKAGLEGDTDLKRPEILRFKGDDFMEQFEGAIGTDDPDLAGYYAARETWRDPAAVGLGTATADELLKLYQPAHGRYYLAAGALVCRKYGLPSKSVDTKADEAAYFVLRRLEPSNPATPVDIDVMATYDEFGWMLNGGSPGWREVEAANVPADEERLPLFPFTYANGAGSRTVLTGLIPAAAREKYEAGTNLPLPEPEPGVDPNGMAALADERLATLDPIVVGFQGLLAAPQMEAPGNGDDEVREALLFALLDLEDYRTSLNDADRAAVDGVLDAEMFKTGVTWLDAVDTARDNRATIEGGTGEALALVSTMTNGEIAGAIIALGIPAPPVYPDFPPAAFDTPFFDAIEVALPPLPPEPAPAPDDEEEAGEAVGAVYVVRFGYERPHCAMSHRLVLSSPSRAFELSSFFDSDAPVRPVRIDLSIDTSPAGLRKFAKGGVSVAISKQLREQIERVQAVKLEALEDGEIPEGQKLDFGMICTLSIPIITICALILLMIIVSILNIVFWWLPLFKICRPKA